MESFSFKYKLSKQDLERPPAPCPSYSNPPNLPSVHENKKRVHVFCGTLIYALSCFCLELRDDFTNPRKKIMLLEVGGASSGSGELSVWRWTGSVPSIDDEKFWSSLDSTALSLWRRALIRFKRGVWVKDGGSSYWVVIFACDFSFMVETVGGANKRLHSCYFDQQVFICFAEHGRINTRCMLSTWSFFDVCAHLTHKVHSLCSWMYDVENKGALEFWSPSHLQYWRTLFWTVVYVVSIHVLSFPPPQTFQSSPILCLFICYLIQFCQHTVAWKDRVPWQRPQAMTECSNSYSKGAIQMDCHHQKYLPLTWISKAWTHWPHWFDFCDINFCSHHGSRS